MGLAALLTRTATPTPPAGRDSGEGPTWYPSRTTPVPVTEDTAQSLPPFFRGLAYVSGAVGLLPVHAYRERDQLNPQPPVLRQPDPRQGWTPMAFWAGAARSLILHGNAVALIVERDRLGWPTALRLVEPRHASVRLVGDPSEPDIGGWYIDGHVVDPSDVWHVRSYLGRSGWPLGVGLLESVTEGIGLALALQTYALGYFNGGGLPTSVIKVHRPELTQEQADDVRSQFRQRFGSGSDGPAVLNDLTELVPVAANPVESQLLEARQFSVSDCALMFGLPPSKLGAPMQGMTYRNAEQEELQARNDGVMPWTAILEQAISLELLPRGQHAMWNMDARLRTDQLTRFQAYAVALGQNGVQPFMTVDEVRAIEGYDPMAEALADDAATADIEDEEPAPAPAGPGGPAVQGAAVGAAA